MKDHAVPSHLSVSSVVHHLCRAPLLKYVWCQVGSQAGHWYIQGTRTVGSGQGSQNVWVELYYLVEDSGNPSQQVGSARRWLKEGSEQAFGWVGGDSPSVRSFGSSDRRGSDRVLGRLFRTEVWVGEVCPVVLLGNVTHKEVWNYQQFSMSRP
jgi:hypothetical protein